MAQYPPPAQAVVVVQPAMFGDAPTQTVCSNCRNQIVTTTVKELGNTAYIAALVVCLLCCPCFWIPLVMDSCKDTVHICPSCNAYLGTKKA